jgi:TPP-dependent pyruvate/acetoin dehydrogenase alpha subunit
MVLDKNALLDLYYYLFLTRSFENLLVEMYADKSLPEKPMTSIGQEASAVGATFCLRKDDYVLPALRTRGAFFTKGITATEYLLEVLRKGTGISGGRWTAHHIGDIARGLILGSAVVSSSIPVAVGTALATKIRGTDQVTLIFFGDGGSSTGEIHSALNFAAVLNLPVVFVCENNRYALSTPIALQTHHENIADRAFGYGIEGDIVDGQDVIEVVHSVSRAVHRARRGSGPSLIECKTYHFRGHSESHNPDDGRPIAELAQWRARDPIRLFEEYLKHNDFTDIQLEPIRSRVASDIQTARRVAAAAPEPSTDSLQGSVYA